MKFRCYLYSYLLLKKLSLNTVSNSEVRTAAESALVFAQLILLHKDFALDSAPASELLFALRFATLYPIQSWKCYSSLSSTSLSFVTARL
jgi:hypothetical protein